MYDFNCKNKSEKWETAVSLVQVTKIHNSIYLMQKLSSHKYYKEDHQAIVMTMSSTIWVAGRAQRFHLNQLNTIHLNSSNDLTKSIKTTENSKHKAC